MFIPENTANKNFITRVREVLMPPIMSIVALYILHRSEAILKVFSLSTLAINQNLGLTGSTLEVFHRL